MYVLPGIHQRSIPKRKRGTPTHTLIVLGSGGHTAEMLLLLRDLDTAAYTFRRYVISSGDDFSAQRLVEFESNLAVEAKKGGREYGGFDFKEVARARNIHQSLWTTPLSAVRCFWGCISILRLPPSLSTGPGTYLVPYPDLILANGPGTAAIMVFASCLIRYIGLKGANDSMRCIYVESWARVQSLSLSGKILSTAGLCDRFMVQWKTLARKGFEYRGQLVA